MFRRVRPYLTLMFIAALVFLIVNGAISIWSLQTLYRNNELVIHTLDVLETVEGIRSELNQTESSQRGFLLTGQSTFKESFDASSQRVPARIDKLRSLVSDNPTQTELKKELRKIVDSRLELLAENLRIKEEQGIEAIMATGRFERGRQEMQRASQIVNEIEAVERSLLESRTAASRNSTLNTFLTLGVSNLVSIGLVMVVFYLIRRDLDEREREERLLVEANEELESKVIERTKMLADTNTELERSNRELQDFAFVASHDLQEPLRKIQAFGDRLVKLQGPKFDEQGRDYLARMQGAAERMHTLINDLLTFSRVTTQAKPFVPTDLSVIVHDVLSDLESRIEETEGTVNVGELPTVDADETQMRQLFQNLIGNALKFHKEQVPPVIRISTELIDPASPDQNDQNKGQTVRILVKDNGIGFDEKYLDRIFTPFQRLHGRSEYEGTGIGLAVCRKIVERHGGELIAESIDGEGSTFIITLPMKQMEEA